VVEHVRVRGVVAHHGRADGGEAKVLLEGPRRADDGVLVHLERVYGVRDMRLRGGEGGRLHRVVERVVMQVGLGVGVGRYHDAVHGRHKGRGLGAPLGRLISSQWTVGDMKGGPELTRRSSMLVLRTCRDT
jgi:hypothetical protein